MIVPFNGLCTFLFGEDDAKDGESGSILNAVTILWKKKEVRNNQELFHE